MALNGSFVHYIKNSFNKYISIKSKLLKKVEMSSTFYRMMIQNDLIKPESMSDDQVGLKKTDKAISESLLKTRQQPFYLPLVDFSNRSIDFSTHLSSMEQPSNPDE